MRRVSIVLGVVLALTVATFVSLAEEDGQFVVPGEVAAAAAARLADAHIGDLFAAMKVLASTADLQVGVWGGMRDLLAQFEQQPVSFNAWFLLPDGSYYKVEEGLTDQNLSDRAYFPKVMAGEATLGDLVVSKSTGRKSMAMTVPIERSGAVIGALGVTVYLDDLSRLIAEELALPEGFVLFAYAEDGEMALHSNPNLLLEEVAESGVDLAAAATATSSLLGWTFVVGIAGD